MNKLLNIFFSLLLAWSSNLSFARLGGSYYQYMQDHNTEDHNTEDHNTEDHNPSLHNLLYNDNSSFKAQKVVLPAIAVAIVPLGTGCVVGLVGADMTLSAIKEYQNGGDIEFLPQSILRDELHLLKDTSVIVPQESAFYGGVLGSLVGVPLLVASEMNLLILAVGGFTVAALGTAGAYFCGRAAYKAMGEKTSQ